MADLAACKAGPSYDQCDTLQGVALVLDPLVWTGLDVGATTATVSVTLVAFCMVPVVGLCVS